MKTIIKVIACAVLFFFCGKFMFGLFEKFERTPVQVTHSATIIAVEHNQVKSGKNGFRNQYNFAVIYDDKKLETIEVNLSSYATKKVGDRFEWVTSHYDKDDSSMWPQILFLLLTGISWILFVIFAIWSLIEIFEYLYEKQWEYDDFWRS